METSVIQEFVAKVKGTDLFGYFSVLQLMYFEDVELRNPSADHFQKQLYGVETTVLIWR